jgi:uncharacterized protein YecT (DUF1311 family)
MLALLVLVATLMTPQGPPNLNCKQPQSQMEMNFCATRDAKTAERELNVFYNRLLERMHQVVDESNQGSRSIETYASLCSLKVSAYGSSIGKRSAKPRKTSMPAETWRR